MYWLSYEDKLMMGTSSLMELLGTIRIMRRRGCWGKITVNWVGLGIDEEIGDGYENS